MYLELKLLFVIVPCFIIAFIIINDSVPNEDRVLCCCLYSSAFGKRFDEELDLQSNVKFFFLFIFYLLLCWVFVSVRGLSLVVASGGHSSSRCTGLSLSWPLLLRSTGSRCAGSAVVAHGPSCSAACGIFPDQGSNLCPLHWQADSQPLRHQGSPKAMLNSG